MDPSEFLKTAIFLNNEKDEHHLRTSMSRSYYAVHLHVRQFISKTFLAGKDFKFDSHQYVLKCCNNCKSEDIKILGVILNDLLQDRLDADYNMDLEISSMNSQDSLDDASELLAGFDTIVAIPTNRQQFSQSSIQQAKFARILV